MYQMYKFFIKDLVIEVHQSIGHDSGELAVPGSNDPHLLAKNVIADLLKENVVCYVLDTEIWVTAFLSHFKTIRAGGGYVMNDRNELLMIHRRGFWDLPKGKLERNETMPECAMREVEEECGVKHLSIQSDAFITYHLYIENREWILKESHWYKMKCAFQPLHPQLEEQITQAVWVKLPVDEKMKIESYRSILEVLNHFAN